MIILNQVEDPNKSSSNLKFKEKLRNLIDTFKEPEQSDEEFLEKSVLEALEYKEGKKQLEDMIQKVEKMLLEVKDREEFIAEEQKEIKQEREKLESKLLASTPHANTSASSRDIRKFREEAHRIHWNTEKNIQRKVINTEIDDLISHLESRWAELDKLELNRLKELMEQNRKEEKK